MALQEWFNGFLTHRSWVRIRSKRPRLGTPRHCGGASSNQIPGCLQPRGKKPDGFKPPDRNRALETGNLPPRHTTFKPIHGILPTGIVPSLAPSPPFSSFLDETVFSAVYVAWFLSEMIGPRIGPGRRGRYGVKREGDRGSGFLINMGLFFSIAVGFAFGYAGISLLPHVFFYVGIAAMVLGILLRQWAIAVLGAFFSRKVMVLDDHRVVRTGPYRYVRHPSYAGALLTLAGVGLALTSWGATLVILVFSGFAYGYRIRVEEGFLVRELGPEYVAYMKETKRLIPFVL